MNKRGTIPPEAAEVTQSGPARANDSDTMTWENQFLEQKEVYRQILDAIDDMVLVKGERSRIVWANKAFRDYYGMSNKQLRQIIDAPFNEAENTKQYVIDDRHVYTTGQMMNTTNAPLLPIEGTNIHSRSAWCAIPVAFAATVFTLCSGR